MRPLLSSDITPGTVVRSSSSSGSQGSNSRGSTPEDEEKLKQNAIADIVYPDKLDHREIVLSSSSEGAMGQERKDEWVFTFDKVRNTTRFHREKALS